jgi:DNA-directed RNA polymerase subunit RPC12/RpoP
VSESKAVQGQVFRCLVCRAEVTVVRAGGSLPTPRCCNRFIVLEARLARVFYCVNCGAEVTVIREGGCVPAPRCCNRFMLPKVAAQAA